MGSGLEREVREWEGSEKLHLWALRMVDGGVGGSWCRVVGGPDWAGRIASL